MLELGVIKPLLEFIVKPNVELYVPPVYEPVPANVAACVPLVVQTEAEG